jgi:hypothetical protein
MSFVKKAVEEVVFVGSFSAFRPDHDSGHLLGKQVFRDAAGTDLEGGWPGAEKQRYTHS